MKLSISSNYFAGEFVFTQVALNARANLPRYFACSTNCLKRTGTRTLSAISCNYMTSCALASLRVDFL